MEMTSSPKQALAEESESLQARWIPTPGIEDSELNFRKGRKKTLRAGATAGSRNDAKR